MKPISEAIKEFELNESKPLDGYNDWLALVTDAEKDSMEKSDALNKISGDNKGGLTPEDVRNSKEFKKAKSDYELSAKKLRDINKLADKKWLKQKAVDRRNKKLNL